MTMLPLLMIVLLQAPPIPQQQAQADPNVRGSIQGVVRLPNGGDGIADVQVTLNAAPGARGASTVNLTGTTDSSGRFSFGDVPLGSYMLTVRRDGYFPQSGGPGLPNIAGLPAGISVAQVAGLTAPAIITKDRPNSQASFTLVKGGVISGQLRDPQGKPAAGVPVIAMRAGYQDGRRTLTAINTSTGLNPLGSAQATTDRGDYRIFWLPPGEYFIRTDAGNGIMRTTTGSTVPQLTYFPGTTDSSRAVTVNLHSGEEISAIDFTIDYAAAFKISGKVTVSVPGGMVMPNGQLSRSISSFYVVPQNADPGERIPLTTSRSSSTDQVDFDFEISGVPPGAYYLFPLFADRQNTGNGLPIGNYYSTRIPVEVFDRDVTGIRGVIQRNPDVTARVIFQGDRPAGAAAPPPVRVQLRAQEALGTLLSTPITAVNQQVRADGSILFPNLFPSKYKIALPLPPGYYLADLRQGPLSLYNDAGLTITSEESPPIEITLSTGGGEVRGIVRDRQGMPASARVILVPQVARRGNSMLYKGTTSTTRGEFNITGIAPGDYKIFAWATNPAGAEENSEFIAKYESRGRPLSISAGATLADLTLDLIPND
jgi:hypothetical protein